MNLHFLEDLKSHGNETTEP